MTASALPCRLSSGRRTTRALLSTLALGVVVIGTPAVVVALVLRAMADGVVGGDTVALAVAVALTLLWLLLVVVVAGELRGADRPARRSNPLVAGVRRIVARAIEISLLGTGTLAGWTSTRVGGSLAELEQPGPTPRPRRRPRPAPASRPARRSRVAPASPPAASAESAPPPETGPPAAVAGRPPRSHQVRHGETWWSLAELYLGDGGRASVLKELNAARPQPDGSVVDHKRPLRAGWTIAVPPEEEGAR